MNTENYQIALAAAFQLNGEILADPETFPGYEGTVQCFNELLTECFYIVENEGIFGHVAEKFYDNQLEIAEGEREVDYYLY